MTVTTEPARINNADQHRILAAFAGGADINTMVDTMGISRDYVSGIVSRLCSFNRNTARQLVAEYDQRRAAPKNNPATPAPPAAAPAAPRPQPAPSEAAPTVARPRNVDGLLHAASRSPLPRATTLAVHIRQLANELAQVLDRGEEEAAARAAVAAKRRELDEAETRLRELTGKAARQAHPSTGVVGKRIRAWAKNANVECPAHGRIPARVVAAYQEANP